MPSKPQLCDPIPAPQNLASTQQRPTTSPSPPPVPQPAFDVLSNDEVHTSSPEQSKDVPEPSQIPFSQSSTRKLCVRHQRMADEGTSLKLQQSLDALPLKERETVNMIWSTFSSSSHSRRALILHGILTMCCFSQLSLLTEQLHQLIRLDPFRVLPREVCLQILKGLDAISLGRAAQVSTHWRSLADDDILWKNICEQHIDKKCSKCGWGLPLLGKRRTLPSPSQSSSSLASKYDPEFPASTEGRPTKRRRGNTPDFEDRRSAGSPPTSICTPGTVTRPWKDVYCERLTIERNWRRGRYSVRTLQGHADGIMCMQFSETLAHPQYPVLITGSYDRTVRVWNMETGEEKTRMVGHTRAIRALQFDEAKLITASMDHTLRVWNWRNGACIRILEGHTEGVVCLNFDVNVLASGSVDTTVMIWNFRTGERFTLRGHRDWVNSVVLWDNPDVERRPDDSAASEFNIDPGKMLFSASDDASIRLWDLNSRTCVRQFLGHVGQVQSLRIVTLDRDASETELLAPGNEDGEHDGERQDINDEPCFGPESGLPSRAPAVTNAYTFSTEFNSYMNRADLNGAPSQKAFVYPNTGVFNKGKQKQLSRSSSPMRKKGPTQVLVSGSLDNTIKVWDIETSKSLKTLFGHIEGVWAIACDKLRLVSGSHDRTIKVWVREEGRCMTTLVGHRGAVTCLALGDDKIVSGSDDGDVKIWDFSAN